MVQRLFWQNKIEQAWKKRNIIWLSGVRRIGKTKLCQSIPGIEYFDCELPRVRAILDDPESFLNEWNGKCIALDEIHRLQNPSELLKIAADHFPKIKIIATGSSTLGASAKFKDTLTGRKVGITMTPLIVSDMDDFQKTNLKHRLLFGGLPSFFLSKDFPERDIQEWIDAYWAKDIQELFRLGNKYAFQKFVELLMAQSGGIFEATSFSAPCEVSRGSISNFLKILEATYIVSVVRPFSTRKTTEILSAPKVYGFDTGFVCYYKGWAELRREDLGLLWEHFVLNELQANLQVRDIQYWRDKRGHEVDFVLARRGMPPIAIECKWSAKDFDSKNVHSFWKLYPKAELFVVSPDEESDYKKDVNGMSIRFCGLEKLVAVLQ